MNETPKIIASPEARAWVNDWLDRYVMAHMSETAIQVTEEMGIAFDLAMLRVRERERSDLAAATAAKDFRNEARIAALENALTEARDALTAVLSNKAPPAGDEDPSVVSDEEGGERG